MNHEGSNANLLRQLNVLEITKTEKTKVAYAAKDLVALAKEIKQQAKSERQRQRLEAKTLANELRVSNEKEKLQEVDFFN